MIVWSLNGIVWWLTVTMWASFWRTMDSLSPTYCHPIIGKAFILTCYSGDVSLESWLYDLDYMWYALYFNDFIGWSWIDYLREFISSDSLIPDNRVHERSNIFILNVVKSITFTFVIVQFLICRTPIRRRSLSRSRSPPPRRSPRYSRSRSRSLNRLVFFCFFQASFYGYNKKRI